MTIKPLDGAPTVAVPDSAFSPQQFGEAHEGFAEAHRRLLADRSIQFDLPRVERPETPAWLADFVRAIYPVLQVVFWALLAALALYVLYALISWASGRGWPWRRRAAEAEAGSWRPDEAPARQLLGEADQLAARGLYAEAARLLLFRSIEDIDSRRPDLVRPALTSRDIAALADIPGGPRSAFARIAMMVERSLFGQRPLAEGDWRDCRSAYEEFAFAEGWRG
jgi:hypothetical protein